MRRVTPALLILIALTCMSFMAGDSIKLRLKPQQGKTYTLIYKNNTTNKMEILGQTMNQSVEMEMRQTFTANKVSNTQSVFETQVDALRMSTSVMGTKMEYDSEHPEKNSPLWGDLGEDLKKPQTVTYDASGHVVGGAALAGQLDAVILQFPDKELSVGSKWTSTRTQNIDGVNYKLDIEYKVASISKKSVNLTFNGVYHLDMSQEAEGIGTYKGTYCIDPQTGIMTSSTGLINLSMTVNEDGYDIPVTTEGTTVLIVK